MNKVNTRYIPPPEVALPEFPQESRWDAAVIGAGPNGLIAALYLSALGLKTIVLERRYEMGGGLATEEVLFPGNLTNTHAVYHMMTDYLPVLRDFPLERHGLIWIKPSWQAGILFSDGEGLLFGRMVQDSKDSVSGLTLAEGEQFEKVYRKWRRFVEEILAPATYTPPLPPLELAERFQRTLLGKEFLALSERSPLEVIDSHFSHPRLKAFLLYLIAMWGVDPEEPGMGFMVPLLIVRGTQKYYCYGGSHRFASALGREILARGGMILDNAEVVRIGVSQGRCEGVYLKDGRVILTPVVLSSLPPTQTFFELIGEENLPQQAREDLLPLKNWEWDPWSFFTLHLVLDHPPRFRHRDERFSQAFMSIIGLEDDEDLLRYFRGLKTGEFSRPLGHFTCESLWDETLSRTGKTIAFLQVCAPYDYPWEEKKGKVEEDCLKLLNEYGEFPVVGYHSETPREIEARLKSMVRGSIKHGAYTPLQMGYYRPCEACSSSRTPISGLYLCGASTYPGGLIIGGPGYICAQVVARDLDRRPPWNPPPFVERYLKTYMEA